MNFDCKLFLLFVVPTERKHAHVGFANTRIWLVKLDKKKKNKNKLFIY